MFGCDEMFTVHPGQSVNAVLFERLCDIALKGTNHWKIFIGTCIFTLWRDIKHKAKHNGPRL